MALITDYNEILASPERQRRIISEELGRRRGVVHEGGASSMIEAAYRYARYERGVT